MNLHHCVSDDELGFCKGQLLPRKTAGEKTRFTNVEAGCQS